MDIRLILDISDDTLQRLAAAIRSGMAGKEDRDWSQGVRPLTPAQLEELKGNPPPEKKTRGRPKKEAAPGTPATTAPATPVEPAPTPAAPEVPAAPPPVALPDRDMVIIALTAFRNKLGRPAVLELLAKFGGTDSLTSVPEKNWPALYQAAKAGV